MREFFTRIAETVFRSRKDETTTPAEEDTPLFPYYCITKNGLQAIAEYYDLKYPDRGKITPVFFDLNSDPRVLARDLKKTFRGKYPAKIVITTTERDIPHHSHPFILTKDKLISLRNDKVDYILYDQLAQALKLPIVRPRETSEYFQADSSSCHFIAFGILKDLTKKDLRHVCKFEDGHTPMPKSLKYCQSRGYLGEVLDEQTKNEPVKKDGRTAYQYLIDNRTEKPYPNPPETRIQVKEARLIEALKSSPSQSPRAAAEYALEKLSKEKSDKRSV